MAIFRAGKRVGPFDIRVGFPRDKSLDNVDRDPRLNKEQIQKTQLVVFVLLWQKQKVMLDQQDLL